jgi:hypothetical protein
MHDPEQREEDRVHQANDSKDHSEEANSLLMRCAFRGQVNPLLQPIGNLIDPRDDLFEIGLGDKIRQDVVSQRLSMRFGRPALDPGGFERLRVCESIDGHRAAPLPNIPFAGCYIPKRAKRARLESTDHVAFSAGPLVTSCAGLANPAARL